MHKQLSRTQEHSQTSAPAYASPSLATATPMTAMGTYAYAGGVVQRQAVETSASAPGPHAAEAGGEDAAAGINRTGLPDNLKAGIEALSGVSLDRVKVHYNSAAPARLDAHAYAQGSDIHLARGQERHLPHEAWHLVQQAQGRVAPALQSRGVPINDDPLLEQEADRMGEAALRLPDGNVRSDGLPTATHGVAQRMPDEALENLSKKQRRQEAIQQLIRVLANARRWSQNYPLIATTTETFMAIRRVLHHQIQRAVDALGGKDGTKFVRQWNTGPIDAKLEEYDPGDEDARLLPPAPRGSWNELEAQKGLQDWEGKKIADKKMFADLKLSRLIPLILDEADYPDDVKLALKLFFSHTASFIPEERLGRDFRELEHGTYFRTSPSLARTGNSEQLKTDYRNEWGRFPSGKTAQVLNQALHGLLKTYGNLAQNIFNAELIADDSNPLLSYAVYTASNKSGTGSLGLMQNIYRTLSSGTQVEPRFAETSSDTWERTLAGDRFAPVVAEELLASSSEQNYHDLLLAERGRLIREVAEEIKARYGKDDGDAWKVVPIQSQEHASLILEVKYPQGTHKKDQLKEAAWREAFIDIFNSVAADMKLQTRVTHRGSFGFLYPSVSSVGTPVRIWPGLVPDDVFKTLVFSTLDALAKDEYWGDKTPFQQPDSSKPSSTSKKKLPLPQPGDGIVLHLEALKSAVRYAQDLMRETLTVKGPPGLINWLSVRLQRNLRKALHLLAMPVKQSLEDQESAYLKSAGVIENLMEYSYLLEAVRADAPPSNDPYPAYLRRKLAISDNEKDPSHRKIRTFYLDSGMQAIVSAHLLARNWALEQTDSPKKGLRSIDLYTYFEYAGIDKEKLYFEAQNRNNSGYRNVDDFRKVIEKEFDKDSSKPTVISADLNPVFTTLDAAANQVPYQDVFKHFAGDKNKKGLNPSTIPIVDVTNSTLDKAAELKLGEGYQNYIVVESLSKHQQLGADKFTMGRLTVIGNDAFVKLAGELLNAVEDAATHRLPSAYRLRMDRVFYGDSSVPRTLLVADELTASKQYDAFMALMGLDEAWGKLDRSTAGTPEELQLRYVAMKELLDIGLRRYVEEVRHDGNGGYDLQKAFQSLPPPDRRHLLQWLERQFGPEEEEESLVENPGMLQTAVEIGVTNVGNTCYLSAALNMLAFSPYRDLFQPQQDDPNANLRTMIRQALDKIVAGQLVTYDEVSLILAALDHARLLEEPHALANHRALNAQRDPAEVLEYVLNFFGVQQNDYLLGQTTHRRLDLLNAQAVNGGDPARYSDVNAFGHYAPVQAADWMIKLPIANFAGLYEAMHAYLAQEQTAELTGVSNRGTDQQRVLQGPGFSQVMLGGQTPRVISIQLIRWVVRNRRISKDNRSFNIPDQFQLNGFVYRLKTVIYHRGQSYDVGHYTTSTRGDDDTWQYRDDRRVLGNDQNLEQRKNHGYIYTYVRGPAANLGNIALLGQGQPPDQGHQGDDYDRDDQPPRPSRSMDDVDMDDSSSSSEGSGQTRDWSKKRKAPSSPSSKKRKEAKSRDEIQTELKISSKNDEQIGGTGSGDDSQRVEQGDQSGKQPRKKPKLL